MNLLAPSIKTTWSKWNSWTGPFRTNAARHLSNVGFESKNIPAIGCTVMRLI
jgi:hypothetical protein